MGIRVCRRRLWTARLAELRMNGEHSHLDAKTGHCYCIGMASMGFVLVVGCLLENLDLQNISKI